MGREGRLASRPLCRTGWLAALASAVPGAAHHGRRPGVDVAHRGGARARDPEADLPALLRPALRLDRPLLLERRVRLPAGRAAAPSPDPLAAFTCRPPDPPALAPRRA